MNAPTAPTSLERSESLQGLGCKRRRVEDVRFIQGKGRYVDDLKLPGMLHGDFHRSSRGHARIVRIDTSKAKALPGVVAVLTAEDLKGVNLAWMPTLAGDVQMVLADGKVLFQNQEIAFVVATDRYVAADAADLVEVEYEPLPVVVDPFKAMEPDAPVLREDIKEKTTARMGRASIRTTSSPGRSATASSPTPRSPMRKSPPRISSATSACTPVRSRPARPSSASTRSTEISPSTARSRRRT